MLDVPTPSKFSHHPVLVALGKSIRKRRKELKVSQEQLAQAAGLDRSYLGAVERGENSVALITLKTIADSLETTVTALVSDANI